MTYERACTNSASLPHINHLVLNDRRHLVGLWTTDARVITGGRADEIDGIQESRSEPFSHLTMTWKTLTIGGGKWATGSLGFEIARKDNAVVFETAADHPYESSISEAKDMTVLFYSSHYRRGWLIDGASALVYLARARLTFMAPIHKDQNLLEHVRSAAHLGETALETLMRLGEQRIFMHQETKHETTTKSASPSPGPTDNSADSGYVSGIVANKPVPKTDRKDITTTWPYRKLVLELWHNLSQMQASLYKLKSHDPQAPIRKPGHILTGWEAKDVIRYRKHQAPRFVDMNRESEQWLKYTEATTSVVLLARDFGDLIVPSNGAPVCESMHSLPVGRCLLAVPLYILRLKAERYLLEPNDCRHGCVRIHDSIYLYTSDPVESCCRCQGGSRCQPISALQKRAKRGPAFDSASSHSTVFDNYPKGAVIIGRPRLNEKPIAPGRPTTRGLYSWVKQQIRNSGVFGASSQPSAIAAEADAESEAESISSGVLAPADQPTAGESVRGSQLSDLSALGGSHNSFIENVGADVGDFIEQDGVVEGPHTYHGVPSASIYDAYNSEACRSDSSSEYHSAKSRQSFESGQTLGSSP